MVSLKICDHVDQKKNQACWKWNVQASIHNKTKTYILIITDCMFYIKVLYISVYIYLYVYACIMWIIWHIYSYTYVYEYKSIYIHVHTYIYNVFKKENFKWCFLFIFFLSLWFFLCLNYIFSQIHGLWWQQMNYYYLMLKLQTLIVGYLGLGLGLFCLAL